MTNPYCAVAFLGAGASGKSTIAGALERSLSLPNERIRTSEISELRFACDRLDSERQSGFSAMAAYRGLTTPKKDIELIVTPGKRKFWKGVDHSVIDADAAVIVVRVSKDESIGIPALIEPIALCIGMGVPVLAVVLNVLPVSSVSDQDGFERMVSDDLKRVFPDSQLPPVLPVKLADESGLTDLLSILQDVSSTVMDLNGSQLAINTVFSREDGVIVGGRLMSGSIHVGDDLWLMPSRVPVKVESLRISGSLEVSSADAGRIIGLKIAGLAKNHVSTGMVLVSDPRLGSATRRIKVEVNLFNAKFPISVGFSPMVTIRSCHVHARVSEIHGDKQELVLGDTAIVTLSLTKTTFANPFPSPFGRVLLRHENVLVAVGVIREILD